MNPELKAAAERLRDIRDNLPTRPKWTKADYVDFYERDVLFLLELVEGQMPPNDDDEPLTEDWLRSVGFEGQYTEHDEPVAYLYFKNDGVVLRRLRVNNEWRIDMHDRWEYGPQSRGDLRRLCAALGVALKENNDA